jgi:epoxyqueuosine reductase
MDDLTGYIKDELRCHGADLVGIGDLTELPSDIRYDMPLGICVAVKYPKEVISGIIETPTKEYYDFYGVLNKRLDMLVTLGADALKMFGYQAIAQTTNFVEKTETEYTTLLPHKTVATRAALGWIGKSALLVTKKYGSAIRISSILTDAPLKCAKPINKSKCGNCLVCTNACPAHAILGKNWSVDTYRDEFYNAGLCRKTARERALQSFGIEITQCGKCIAVCPYTQKYLNEITV